MTGGPENPLSPDDAAMLADATNLANGRGVIGVEGAFLTNVHPAGQCAGETCWVHRPSEWPLRDAPVVADRSTLVIYRRCEHGRLHLDIDDRLFRRRHGTRHRWSWVSSDAHPCCSQLCCVGAPATDVDRKVADGVADLMAMSYRAPTEAERAEILRHAVADRLFKADTTPER